MQSARRKNSSKTRKRVRTTEATGGMHETKDALEIIDEMVGDDTELREMIADERANATIAQMIYRARTKAGLTQKELADRVGTKQPVIARLEDAEYEGHSLSMLNRIAKALNRRLRVEMSAVQPDAAHTKFTHGEEAEKLAKRARDASPSSARTQCHAASKQPDDMDIRSGSRKARQQRPGKRCPPQRAANGSP